MKKISWLFLEILLLVSAAPAFAQDRVNYTLEYSTSRSAHVRVTIQPSSPIKGPVTLIIPRAITGGYDQQFYDRYVQEVKAASSAGAALKVVRQDGPRWLLGSAEVDVTQVEYDVDLARLEREILNAADTSKARPGYVGLLGYSIFGYLEGLDAKPIRLEVNGPQGWPVLTTLAPKFPADNARTAAVAKDFYALADSQVAMGPKLQVQRLDAKASLFLILYAEVDTNVTAHGEIFADAFRKVSAFFGDAPFSHYTAYIEILKPLTPSHEYGFSMEHLDSSTYFLGVDRAITSTTTPVQLERERYNFAHHISHSWIPKQVYGVGYLPFTWELAPQIETIWFNEGFARFITIEALADSSLKRPAKSTGSDSTICFAGPWPQSLSSFGPCR